MVMLPFLFLKTSVPTCLIYITVVIKITFMRKYLKTVFFSVSNYSSHKSFTLVPSKTQTVLNRNVQDIKKT